MVESIVTKEACIYCNGEGRTIIHVFAAGSKYVDCPYCFGTGYEREEEEPIK